LPPPPKPRWACGGDPATLAAWREYRHACELRLRLDPPAPGPVCNRSFDMYACWGDAAPNSTVTVPCPWYLPWHHRVQGGVVARRCGPDGHWVPRRDVSRCGDMLRRALHRGVCRAAPLCLSLCPAVLCRALPCRA
uniref:G-protein coupled receptors family 2 profile 1 domain-containing protein n=1 Tax=Otus sunia TaxID=257818 RepID=A0A8C8E6Y4_9STRI